MPRPMTALTTLPGPRFEFKKPMGVVADKGDLWVTNQAGDSVTEIAADTGRVVRVVVDHTNLPTPDPSPLAPDTSSP